MSLAEELISSSSACESMAEKTPQMNLGAGTQAKSWVLYDLSRWLVSICGEGLTNRKVNPLPR